MKNKHQEKYPMKINGLLADFDGKTVAVPDFLNGL